MPSNNSRRHRIAPDLEVASVVTVDIKGDTGFGPYDLEVDCIYNVMTERYEVTNLSAHAWGGIDAPGISSVGLRQIPMQEIVRRHAQPHVRGVDDGWVPATMKRARPKSDAEYRDAAREYVAARIIGDPPLERIAHVYQVSKATATRIAAEARRRGFSTDG